MFDYEKFKVSAIKNKYETAFEKDKKQLRYNELSEMVNALFNALFNIGISGSAMIMTGDKKELAITALALSKCGIKRIVCDPKMSKFQTRKLILSHKPALIFLEARELSRLSDTLLDSDIKTVVVYGETPNHLFPMQFDFYELLHRNDYVMIKEYTPTSEIEFQIPVTGNVPDFQQFDVRDGIVLDLPPFCKAVSQIMSELLYSGRKCCEYSKINAKVCKKRGITLFISDKSKLKRMDPPGCEVFDAVLSLPVVDNSFADIKTISAILSKITKAKVEVSFNGAVFCVKVIYPANSKIEDPATDPGFLQIRETAIDLLYPFNKKKTITAKKICK